MLSPYKIEWDSRTSLDFDCWTEISFDGDDGETETHLSREAVVSESYNGVLKRAHNYKWNEVFTFKMTIIKQDYSDFTQSENRAILKWLTGRPNAGFIDIYKDDSEVVDFCVLGNWVNVSSYKLGNGRIVGYIAEFEGLTPWALSPLKTVTKDVSNPDNSEITLNISTDEPKTPIYPKITINQKSNSVVVAVDHAMTDLDDWIDGTVYSYNNNYYWKDENGKHQSSTTNTSGFETTSVVLANTYKDFDKQTKTKKTVIKNNIIDETVILDGANRVVSSSRTDGRIFGDDFSWQWLPLVEGTNTISIIGNCTVTIEWREPIKCGEF